MKLKNKQFPIEEALPRLKAVLKENSICILTAPPGAGKTTIVPTALLNEEWLEGRKIIMLEPRRLAARRAAEFMAEMKGEKCGKLIGYRIRTETCVSSETRIEVVTEGILTRMLQSDAELPEAGLIIFDEYHERSIHADTAMAFMLDVQSSIRPDMKILIMSATPDIDKLSAITGNPPVVESFGRAFPVETHYMKHSSDKRIEEKTAEAVLSVLKKEEGDMLVFLPGKGEIRRTADILNDKLRISGGDAAVHELYGEAPRSQQEAALSPAPNNMRKVILSTSIAETSLTIEGVRIVIDAGLSRISGFDVRRGMPGLITVPVSKAAADQRRGRAGRQMPGVCYRLWTKEEEEMHPDFAQPEIVSADLTSLALELAQWGIPQAEELKFPDPPPQAHLKQAMSVLFMLGASDNEGRLTKFGKRMCGLPVHPRLSAMILHAEDRGLGTEACMLAALLEEKDGGGRPEDIDLSDKWHNLHNPRTGRNETVNKRIFEQASRLQKIIGISVKESKGKELKGKELKGDKLGVLLALAYPERVAVRRSGRQYQLAQGTMVSIPESSILLREEFLAVGDVDASGAVAKAFMAAAISKEEILELFKDILVTEVSAEWTDNAVRKKEKLKLGAISVTEKEVPADDAEAAQCITGAFRKEGMGFLPWDKESRGIVERSEWLRLYGMDKNDPFYEGWPLLTDEMLMDTAEEWLSPYLAGVRRKKEIDLLAMSEVIKSLFTYEQLNFLNQQAPAFIKVPGGSEIRLKYDEGEKPVLAVKLQELFGQTDTPMAGRVLVLIHLLSPAMRPLAITQDLRSFWMNVYPDILKQMRIKYHKHVWPDDPLKAQPTNRTKKFQQGTGK